LKKEAKDIDSDIQRKLAATVTSWAPTATLKSIGVITPDASTRRYFRLHLNNSFVPTVVAMVFDSFVSPEAGGAKSIRADESYVELTKFFVKAGLAVPELYFDSRDNGILLIEDLTDCSLGSLLDKLEQTKKLPAYYEAAVNQILLLQNIPFDSNFFAFKRAFTESVYLAEMSEFTDFVLSASSLDVSELSVVQHSLNQLAAELSSMPQVLVHRDFHSWNLIVDQRERVRVIDFQDALLGTRCYDIASLLNDRDSDAAIGDALQNELLELFFKGVGSNLKIEYLKALLQRDLKVAGRFEKLASQRGLKNYLRWVPGTLTRIGKTLNEITQIEGNQFEPLLNVLRTHVPQIANGARSHLGCNGE